MLCGVHVQCAWKSLFGKMNIVCFYIIFMEFSIEQQFQLFNLNRQTFPSIR